MAIRTFGYTSFKFCDDNGFAYPAGTLVYIEIGNGDSGLIVVSNGAFLDFGSSDQYNKQWYIYENIIINTFNMSDKNKLFKLLG